MNMYKFITLVKKYNLVCSEKKTVWSFLKFYFENDKKSYIKAKYKLSDIILKPVNENVERLKVYFKEEKINELISDFNEQNILFEAEKLFKDFKTFELEKFNEVLVYQIIEDNVYYNELGLFFNEKKPKEILYYKGNSDKAFNNIICGIDTVLIKNNTCYFSYELLNLIYGLDWENVNKKNTFFDYKYAFEDVFVSIKNFNLSFKKRYLLEYLFLNSESKNIIKYFKLNNLTGDKLPKEILNKTKINLKS